RHTRFDCDWSSDVCSSDLAHADHQQAIHLGADRLLVIGVRARRAAGVVVDRLHAVMPTPGEIFGYMLDTLFTDQIYGDLEQLERSEERRVGKEGRERRSGV